MKRKNTWIFHVILVLIMVSSVLVAGEIAARLKGYKPWRPSPVNPGNVTIEPGGRIFQPDSIYGFTLVPGKFKMTFPATKYSFTATHLETGRRITRPLEDYGHEDQRPEIWIMGCSFTYGWSINDEETFSYLMQNALQDFEIVNFGVNAYGTLHALMQFDDAIKISHPKVLILSYADFHDMRNTASRSWNKTLIPAAGFGAVEIPYARFAKEGKLVFGMDKLEYRPSLPVRFSALAHMVETQYLIRIDPRFYHNREVTLELLRRLSRRCSEEGVTFIIAGISIKPGTRETLYLMEKEGIRTVDISVDFNDRRNVNLPHDWHPSPEANRHYAAALIEYLKKDNLAEKGK